MGCIDMKSISVGQMHPTVFKLYNKYRVGREHPIPSQTKPKIPIPIQF